MKTHPGEINAGVIGEYFSIRQSDVNFPLVACSLDNDVQGEGVIIREGGTPLHGLYRYVQLQRVWFFSHFGHK